MHLVEWWSTGCEVVVVDVNDLRRVQILAVS